MTTSEYQSTDTGNEFFLDEKRLKEKRYLEQFWNVQGQKMWYKVFPGDNYFRFLGMF